LNGRIPQKNSHKNFLLHKDRLKNRRWHLSRLLPLVAVLAFPTAILTLALLLERLAGSPAGPRFLARPLHFACTAASGTASTAGSAICARIHFSGRTANRAF
jgi:hypothetical protein